MNNKSEIIYYLNDGTCNTNGDLQENQRIKKTVCLGLSDYEYFRSLDVNEQVEFLLRNESFKID